MSETRHEVAAKAIRKAQEDISDASFAVMVLERGDAADYLAAQAIAAYEAARDVEREPEVEHTPEVALWANETKWQARCSCGWVGTEQQRTEFSAWGESYEHRDEMCEDACAAPEPSQVEVERDRWSVEFDNERVAEAVQRVESMLNGDPLRRHTTLTAEQFALDSRLMAKQVVTNVLTALKNEPRPS